MQISQDTVVSVRYKLSDAEGKPITETHEPMVYLHGGYGNTFPKIEAALEGQTSGFKTTVNLDPEEAFGHYDENRVRVEPRDRFPAEIAVGMQFEGVPEGAEQSMPTIFTITEIAEDRVVLDGNHPLVGISLVFDIEIDDVRTASAEEVAHGHVHGEGGHQH